MISRVCSGFLPSLFSEKAPPASIGRPFSEADMPAGKQAFSSTGTSSPTVSSRLGSTTRRNAGWFLASVGTSSSWAGACRTRALAAQVPLHPECDRLSAADARRPDRRDRETPWAIWRHLIEVSDFYGDGTVDDLHRTLLSDRGDLETVHR